ncbi:DEAD/DEAH box helicase [Epibacterium ulvae]|uniref:DEAD/DEAH box helicase n=1 Tax=Epibacterium ulvae TaxID=1156985 RepID=UPI0024905A7A|nr:AAA domain-containing protein [Epibacterium ulvae]
MSRQHFKKSIEQLEAAYAKNKGDGAFCQTLLDELSHRSTQRAQNLKKKILAANDETAPQQKPRPVSELEPKQPRLMPSDVTGLQQGEDRPKVVPFDLGPKPDVKNDALDILRTWTALEVLSPQNYKREVDLVAGDGRRIARLDEAELPWERGEKSKPKKKLFYELVLGAVALAPAVESLLEIYADNRPDKPSMKGFSPIASVLLDKEGRPLDEDRSFAISSFAWGVPVALKGDLKTLAEWTNVERKLKAAMKERLIKRDREDKIMPLDRPHIDRLFGFLVRELELNVLEVKAPYFAMRRYEYFASKTPPEPGLLNSFYLEDLSQAKSLTEANALPNALQHYLGVKTPDHNTDLLKDDVGLQWLLQPALTPAGRWPGSGRFPLALLQQAAVNATNPAHMPTGVLAVNGPPGTGKTTLLRDVVTARIVDRAKAMCQFSNPEKAFSGTTQTMQRSGATIRLHRLDERVKGFEMVVTSSNNKAVENVSAELPALDAVAMDAPNLRYFKAISDNVLGDETWGMISAVLGNSNNRYEFSQNFWRDDEVGMSTFLNHATGVPQVVSEPQKEGPPIKRNRKIVDLENPPANAREANGRWVKAKRTFETALSESQARQSELQELHVQIQELVKISAEIDYLFAQQPILQEEIAVLEGMRPDAQNALASAEAEKRGADHAKDQHSQKRLGVFGRLFKRSQHALWMSEAVTFATQFQEAEQRWTKAKDAFDKLHVDVATKERAIEASKGKIETLRAQLAKLDSQTRDNLSQLDIDCPDADFFAKPHEYIQTASVWYDQASQILRDNVFEAAMALHRAFIEAAADPLRQNLSIFCESFGTRTLGTPEKDALIADLWSSLFLVVPVVSTTFASVHRMFSRLEPEALGWLLVDEAGQAVPQACVGAMIRTKNSVVVGDPLQIEPVVTLPNSLTEEICGRFGVDPLKYNAPEASVQTVADAASIYCAKFPIGSGHRDVGAPLLVHRRCDSPMFDISNEIAYSNLMVQAKKPSPVNPILGQSAWIHVEGKAGPDKWCADEATKLIEMMRKLRDAGAKADLYVVTPFVIVQDNLRREILASGVLEGWVEKPRSWAFEHVGTVHTVQGREAAIVFFVLGAQMSSQNGARNWAGGRPNLVNVAVTRAKASLYVIGNRQLWKTAGVFSVLDRFLPAGAD